ncbi:MAG: YtxH domain-containing protein [Nitrospiraceae bacterium]|nr:YtxH domain-containing protein [Nitrospiraceae bacterium]
MLNNENNNSGELLMSFLIGGIVGAGLALLFAPYSGRKLRGKIADMAEDAGDKASDYVKQVRNKVL